MPHTSETCPLCTKPSRPAHQPFCSQGCKDRDLLNWLGEAYATPVTQDDEESPSTGLDNSA